MVEPLSIRSAGLVSGVGLDFESSCAAIRAGLNCFAETRFIANGGDWVVASEVQLGEPWRGATKLAKMAAKAIGDCIGKVADFDSKNAALLLCVAEESRPGRLADLGSPFFFAIEQELGISFHPSSKILADGRVGGAVAAFQARKMIAKREVENVIVAGVDSFLIGATLRAFDEASRLLTPANSNGFVPGEAAAAVLLSTVPAGGPAAPVLTGLGFAREAATILSEEPLRADGLSTAIAGAVADAGRELHELDYRCADVNGEHYGFRETSLALSRLLRVRKPEFDLWHPADSVGEIGAAVVPAMIATTLAALRDGYAPGPRALLHAGNDDGRRAALVIEGAPTAQAAAA
jgi:3-oxoacyl-[acyl-carrier-protein] synthase I